MGFRLTIFFLCCSLAVFGCAGDDESAPTSPENFAGKTYLLSIEEGGGFLLPTGSFLVRNFDGDIFERVGVSGDTTDSTGRYLYYSSGSLGLVQFVDAVSGEGTLVFDFKNSTSGDFLITLESDPEAFQSGSFSEQL